MKTAAEVIGVSRSNLVVQQRPPKRIGRRPLPDERLVAQIKAAIAELPTYGYRRIHAILKRQALATGLKPPNHKQVHRVMKFHGLLLDRHAGGAERRHDGRIMVDERYRRWCSDGFESPSRLTAAPLQSANEPMCVSFDSYLVPTAREVPPVGVLITEDAPSRRVHQKVHRRVPAPRRRPAAPLPALG
jgi:hypothetical protein